MGLDLFNNIFNKTKESNFIQNFIEELKNYLESSEKMEINKEDKGEIYQVVDFSKNGVYLKSAENDEIFEEKNIPNETLDKIGNDYILRFKQGKYIVDEELTDDFMNSLVDVREYVKIKEEFKNNSNILQNNPNTIYSVQEHNTENTIVCYGINNEKTMNIPNALVPYFTVKGNQLMYRDGKFERVFNKNR